MNVYPVSLQAWSVACSLVFVAVVLWAHLPQRWISPTARWVVGVASTIGMLVLVWLIGAALTWAGVVA